MDWKRLFDRMVRAAKLDSALYEEVEKDVEATIEAMTVVILSSLAAGIGAGLAGFGSGGIVGLISSLIGGTLLALIFWLIWAFLAYWIGTTLLRGPETSATYWEVLRTIGFAASPGVIRILVFIPGLAQIVMLAAGIWSLVTMVVAVRQALDFSTGRAVATCAIAMVIVMALMMLILPLMFGGSPGPTPYAQ